VARCGRCGRLTHPPDTVCPGCGSIEPDFTFRPVAGRGRIRSWTVVRRSLLPGFDADVPFTLVDVELDEQPELRFIGRLLGGRGAPAAIGAVVRVAFEDVGPGVAVPAFTLDEAR